MEGEKKEKEKAMGEIEVLKNKALSLQNLNGNLNGNIQKMQNEMTTMQVRTLLLYLFLYLL